MSILGIPFGAEELLASEWREKMSNKRKLGFDGEFIVALNTLTIKAESQFSGYGFEIFFETDQTIEIETPVIEDGIAYVYTTADQVTKTFSNLQVSMTEPTNENQQGLFDIVIAKINLYTGIDILKKEDIRFSNGYYELTNGDMIHTPSANISCLRLPTGIYSASTLNDVPVSGQGTIQIFENENVRSMIYVDDVGKVYTSNSISSPVEWVEMLTSDEVNELVNTSIAAITPEPIDLLNLTLVFEDTIEVPQFAESHPYDLGYRAIVIRISGTTIISETITPGQEKFLFYSSVPYEDNTSMYLYNANLSIVGSTITHDGYVGGVLRSTGWNKGSDQKITAIEFR